MKALLAAILFGFASLAVAQTPGGDTGRGSIPPGAAQDGSRPADGAITGGSIRPGESGGMQFPGEDSEPDYWDFMYFSFTIGMSAARS